MGEANGGNEMSDPRRLAYEDLMRMNDEEVAIYWISGMLPGHLVENDPKTTITMRALDAYNDNNRPLNFNRR